MRAASGFHRALSLTLTRRPSLHPLSLSPILWQSNDNFSNEIFFIPSLNSSSSPCPLSAVRCPLSMQMCKRCAIVCPVRKCKYWLLGQSTLSLSLSPSHSFCVSLCLCIVLWALFTSHFPSLASMSFCRNVIQICVNRLSSCLMPHASSRMPALY